MELKFREVDESYNVDIEKGIKVRPYLTIKELSIIVDSCLATDNQVERELIKTVMIGRYCTNIALLDDDDPIRAEEYDFLFSIVDFNKIYKEVLNANVIDYCINKNEDAYAIGKMFVDMLDDTLKDFNINKIQNGFMGLKEVLKEVK